MADDRYGIQIIVTWITGGKIQDVMVTLAIYFKVSLVGAGGDDRVVSHLYCGKCRTVLGKWFLNGYLIRFFIAVLRTDT